MELRKEKRAFVQTPIKRQANGLGVRVFTHAQRPHLPARDFVLEVVACMDETLQRSSERVPPSAFKLQPGVPVHVSPRQHSPQDTSFVYAKLRHN